MHYGRWNEIEAYCGNIYHYVCTFRKIFFFSSLSLSLPLFFSLKWNGKSSRKFSGFPCSKNLLHYQSRNTKERKKKCYDKSLTLIWSWTFCVGLFQYEKQKISQKLPNKWIRNSRGSFLAWWFQIWQSSNRFIIKAWQFKFISTEKSESMTRNNLICANFDSREILFI